MSNTFTVEYFEFYLLVLARISGFIFTAPMFNQRNIPVKVKALFSVVVSYITFITLDNKNIEYAGTIDLAVVIVTEVVAGMILGFVCNICVMILAFAGQLADMEIGFSMAQSMNNVNNVTTTVTGNYYIYVVYMVMYKCISDTNITIYTTYI